MQKIKNTLICIGIFLVTILLLWSLLTLSAMIPNEAIHDQMVNSALHFKQVESYSFNNGDRFCSISDNYADSVLLQLSYNIGKGDPLVCSLDTQYYDGGEYGQHLGFYLSLTEEGIAPNVDYSRYWHGSAAFIRLFHLFTDVNGIKWIGLSVVVLLAITIAVILAKHRHYDLAAAFILSCMAVHLTNIRYALEYIPAFVVGFLMCVLYLFFERRQGMLLYLSVIGGTTVAFFDFLTNETVSILLPLILVIAVRSKEGRLGEFRENLYLIIRCGLNWGFSYAATFLTKWSLASIMTGENKFAAAFSSAGERIAGNTSQIVEGIKNPVVQFFAAPLANISTLFGGTVRVHGIHIILGLSITFMVVVSIFYLFGKRSEDTTANRLLISLGAVVFVRYMILNNHSYIHEFFTYRALISPIMALLVIILLNINLPNKRVKDRKK